MAAGFGASTLAVAMLIPAALQGQGTEPKPKPEDYPVHRLAGAMTIAAENMGHGLNTAQGSLLAQDFIVIEVALYSEKNRPLSISAGQFMLRVNGKKTPLYTQSPGLVAASIKYPDWERRPTLVGTAGAGNGEVVIGRPSPVERFPGDPTARQPRIPRAPDPPDRSGTAMAAPMPIEEIVQRSALPEGDVHPPVSGYLFFAYKGRLKGIKSLELLYDGPAGTVSLPLL